MPASVRRLGLLLAVPVVALLLAADAALAQRLNGPRFPTPVLLTVSPPGGKIDTSFDVTLAGLNLQEPEGLLFSQKSIRAERLADPAPPISPRSPNRPRRGGRVRGFQTTVRFHVTVPAGAVPGIHDVRLVNKWGISNPRAFVVGDLPEIAEREPNNDVGQAQRVSLNCTINGAISAQNDVDYYVFAGRKGQRVVLSCLASSIDSRLNAAVDLYDAEGHWLGENRRYDGMDALLDCTLPHDGDYYVRVFQFAYTPASPHHFYRLTISTGPWIDAVYPAVVEPGTLANLTVYGRNLPGGKLDPSAVVDGRVLERKTVTVAIPNDSASLGRLAFTGRLRPVQSALGGFEYRIRNEVGISNPYLLVYSVAPVVLDNEANDTVESAQEIPVPCEIAGRIEKRHDRDWYSFRARRGAVYHIEVYGDRLGAQADMFFVLRDGRTGRTLVNLDDTQDTLSFNKFYTRDTDPPAYRFVVPADGWYQLLVSSRDADALADVRQVYRVRITPELPDFHLVAMPPSNSNAECCTLRQGGDQYLDVFAWREDGFNGSILLTAEDLPPGVICPPQVLGPGTREVALVLHASSDAATWNGPIRIVGTATIHGRKTIREARAASITWPVPPQVSVPLVSRLDRDLLLAVRERAPFRLVATVDKSVLVQGAQTTLGLKLTRLWPEMKGPMYIMPVQAAPGRPLLPLNVIVNRNNNQPITLQAGKDQAAVTIEARPNAQAGTFNLVLAAEAQVPVPGSGARQRQSVVVALPATPITLTILPREVARLSLARNNPTIRAGTGMDLELRVARLNNYDGPLDVDAVLPARMDDLHVAPAVIPAGLNQARLRLEATDSAHLGPHANLALRVIARLNGTTIKQELKFNVRVIR